MGDTDHVDTNLKRDDELLLRMSSALKTKVRVAAAQDGKSMAAYIRECLWESLDGDTEDDKGPE